MLTIQIWIFVFECYWLKNVCPSHGANVCGSVGTRHQRRIFTDQIGESPIWCTKEASTRNRRACMLRLMNVDEPKEVL